METTAEFPSYQPFKGISDHAKKASGTYADDDPPPAGWPQYLATISDPEKRAPYNLRTITCPRDTSINGLEPIYSYNPPTIFNDKTSISYVPTDPKASTTILGEPSKSSPITFNDIAASADWPRDRRATIIPEKPSKFTHMTFDSIAASSYSPRGPQATNIIHGEPSKFPPIAYDDIAACPYSLRKPIASIVIGGEPSKFLPTTLTGLAASLHSPRATAIIGGEPSLDSPLRFNRMTMTNIYATTGHNNFRMIGREPSLVREAASYALRNHKASNIAGGKASLDNPILLNGKGTS